MFLQAWFVVTDVTTSQWKAVPAQFDRRHAARLRGGAIGQSLRVPNHVWGAA